MLIGTIIDKLFSRILPNIRYLPQTKFRTCRCCLKRSIIVSLSDGEEFKICSRCRANLRYEMFAEYLRESCPNLDDLVVIEMDPHSPLKSLLTKAKKFTRTYFSNEDPPGSVRPDGARCEDITKLTLADSSVDVIISSDVLEHVPDITAAFMETRRVLRPGGFHLFTVPPRAKTFKRAEIKDERLVYLTEPDYHSDPLNPEGILAFWDFGTDAIELFSMPGLDISIVDGPRGKDQRLLWKAVKKEETLPGTEIP